MYALHRTLLGVVAAAIVWSAVAAVAFAQTPDPFAPAGAPPAGVDPFAPGGAPPAGGNPFGPGAAPAPGTNPFGPGAPTAPGPAAAPAAPATSASIDPLARRIMESNPQTVDELMAAISNLANLNEGDLVKSLVAKVRQANLDENAKAGLEQRWGAGLFVKLALEPRYAPEAKTFAQEVLDAAKARLTALPHLNQVVSELVVDDLAKRQAAQAELRRAGEACFTPLLNVLGDASREQDKYVAATALLGDFVEPALHASLRSDNETLQTQAMRVLGVRRHDHSLPMILGIAFDASASDTLRAAARESLTSALGGVPSAEETVGFLRRRAKQFHSGAAVGSGNAVGEVVFWLWDATNKTVSQRYLLSRDAAILREAEVAEALLKVAPDQQDHLRLRLMTGLAAAKVRQGWDQPVSDPAMLELCRSAGAPALVDALAAARSERRMLAAVAAAELLGELGDASLLQGAGRPSVLADSLNDREPRIRFAALQAIIKLDSPRAFWGSSVAMDRMAVTATATGTPRALVVHRQEAPGQTWVGMLAELGIEADMTLPPRPAQDQAIRHIDYEFILISDTLREPGLREIIQRLREQPVSGHLPIGILCPGERLFAVQQLALEFDRVEAYPMPYNASRMHGIVTRLHSFYEFSPAPASLRLEQGKQAITWLAKIAAERERYAYYDIHHAEQAAIDALTNPQTNADAAVLLGRIATARAQQALVDLASVPTLPIEMRKAAADGFRKAVQRSGLMLISTEVHQQYDRYNQSRYLPRETQQVLGDVLDTIEGTFVHSNFAAPASG